MLGHRGASHGAPENTLAAFAMAAEEGADGVELDVRLDASGDVVVFHDRTLRRMTAGADERALEALTRRDLDAVDLGGGERAPRLSAVLDWARQLRLRVNVELKQDVSSRAALVRRVAALVAAVPDAPRHVILSSFHPGMVAALGPLVPGVPRAWLVHAGQRLLGSAPGYRLLGAQAIHPERLLTQPARVRRWRDAGAIVNVWTVDDPTEVRDLDALGVDGIISNRPGEALAALGA